MLKVAVPCEIRQHLGLPVSRWKCPKTQGYMHTWPQPAIYLHRVRPVAVINGSLTYFFFFSKKRKQKKTCMMVVSVHIDHYKTAEIYVGFLAYLFTLGIVIAMTVFRNAICPGLSVLLLSRDTRQCVQQLRRRHQPSDSTT